MGESYSPPSSSYESDCTSALVSTNLAAQIFAVPERPIADIFALKIMKSGGIRRALEVAAIARIGGIDVYGGCMFETGVAHAAGAQLMAALPELHLGCEF